MVTVQEVSITFSMIRFRVSFHISQLSEMNMDDVNDNSNTICNDETFFEVNGAPFSFRKLLEAWPNGFHSALHFTALFEERNWMRHLQFLLCTFISL